MAHSIGRRLPGTCNCDRSHKLFGTAEERAAKSGLGWTGKLGAGIHGFAMVITEIFKSIQGEGTRAGLPCVFVRLTGCNLRCTWCDTAYAFHGGTKHSIEEILGKVHELAGDGERRVSLVEITGGEPLLQAETPALAEKLIAAGYTVMIETSGEQFVGVLPHGVIKIVDVKCPDSGEPDTFDMANLEAVGANDEIKFVVSTRRDYDFARDFVKRHRLAERVHEVLFSPVFADPGGTWPGLTARELAEWILSDGLRVRLGLQLHKFIWDPSMKGV
jgi:7-carboxy-7-deazaguanine synthase